MYNNFNGLTLEEMPYVMLRGWALQVITTEIFKRPDWVNLARLSPKAFENKIMDYACTVNCDVTPQFVMDNPQAVAWISKCHRILFKCLIHDWRMDKVLFAEPQLPNIQLPDGREINCGTPDIVGVAEAFNGVIGVEMKSGLRRVGRDNAKLARYNSGASLFAQDNEFNRPFRGTVWITFASKKQNKKNGHYNWSDKPVMTYLFEPYNPVRINDTLQRKFGVDIDTIANLPRNYTSHVPA